MSNLSVNTITNAAGGNTAQINGMTPTGLSLQGFRNRIINGDMRIDQRNAGAAVTVNGGAPAYMLDRFAAQAINSAGAFTVQQSSTAPSGFVNSLLATVTTTDASPASRYRLFQNIEGFNVSDLGWGTANAQAVALSFWVRSSVTGTFGGALQNNDSTRSYPFTFTVSSANTFEYKTVIISGDATGTWLTTNGRGIGVSFSLGANASLSGPAGVWAGEDYRSATGATNLMATLNATFQITGVQLEAGAVATPFERRPFGAELALCQRYFQTLNRGLCGGADSTTQIAVAGVCVVPMRASPTIALLQTTPQFISGGVTFNGSSSAITDSNTNSDSYHLRISGFSGLTTGRACVARFGLGGGFLSLTSEL